VARPPARRVAGLRSRSWPYLLLLPALVPVIVGLGYPLARQFVISFQEYGLAQQFGRPAEWVGLRNYVELLTDSYVWGVIARSIAFCLVNAALTMVVGVALAVLMTKVGRAARVTLQVGMLLAWGTPVLATMTVWQWLFDSQYGVVNWLLAEPLGVEGMRNHSWIIEPLSFYLVATVIVVWMSVPFVVFTVYAGLLQVPAEVEEAAELGGASAWQRFWYLAVPLIRPVLFVVALLQVIWDLRVFTQIYVLQRAGAPTRETHLLGTFIYSLAKEFSMAGAMATIMLLITLALTGFYIRRMLREEEEL
jgi:N,N'-diacetylchitobiose transport system permease protein